jgi:uncharacterized repeat protein (TIGR03803 family)
MTHGGGAYDWGVLFKYEAATGIWTVMHDFANTTDGAGPFGALMQASDGKLYGMTYGSSIDQAGTIFSFDPATEMLSGLHTFNLYAEGGRPFGHLTEAGDGKLYGTMSAGGMNDYGGIFSYQPSTDSFKVEHFFSDPDESIAMGSLLLASDSNLYGLTEGGFSNHGTIFRFNPQTGDFASLYTFSAAPDGYHPYGSFMEASNGKLYCTTGEGGEHNAGTIIEFDPVNNLASVVFSFDGDMNGGFPSGDLIEVKGRLYGMAGYQGTNDCGTLFDFDPASYTLSALHSFNGNNGCTPQGTLLHASDGMLYGLTAFGGNGNAGTLFSYEISTDHFDKLQNLNPVKGEYPEYTRLTEYFALPVGMPEPADECVLTAFPNPTPGHLFISFEAYSPSISEGLLEIQDLTGRKVAAQYIKFNNGKSEAEFEFEKEVHPGIYVLRIVLPDRSYETMVVLLP